MKTVVRHSVGNRLRRFSTVNRSRAFNVNLLGAVFHHFGRLYRHRRQQRRKRRSLLAALLMAIGAVTIFVLLMRYAIVPLLVLLPQWMGGAA